jgi:hypothetical protein
VTHSEGCRRVETWQARPSARDLLARADNSTKGHHVAEPYVHALSSSPTLLLHLVHIITARPDTVQ